MEPPTLGLQYNTSSTLFEVGLRGGRELARWPPRTASIPLREPRAPATAMRAVLQPRARLARRGGRFGAWPAACARRGGRGAHSRERRRRPGGGGGGGARARGGASLGGVDERAAAELAALARSRRAATVRHLAARGVLRPAPRRVAGLGASLWFASRVLADYVLRGQARCRRAARRRGGRRPWPPPAILAARAGLRDAPDPPAPAALALNAAHNSLAAGGGRPPAAVAPLVWGDAAQAAALTREGGGGRPFGVVLARVAYDPDHHGDLLDTLAALAARRGAHRPAARVVLALADRADRTVGTFVTCARRRGWTWAVAATVYPADEREAANLVVEGAPPASRRRLRPAAAAAVVTISPSPVSALCRSCPLPLSAPAAGESLAPSRAPRPRPRYSLRHMASQVCCVFRTL